MNAIDMLDWTLRTLRLCREMRDLSRQALRAFEEDNESAVAIVKGQMQRAVVALGRDLPESFPASRIDDLRRHIGYSAAGDYQDIMKLDLPDIEEKIDAYASRLPGRWVLLPPNRLKLPDEGAHSLSVTLTRKQVEDSPEADRDLPVSRQQETRIYSHFGWEPYWASMAASAALGEPAMTPPVVEPRPMPPLGDSGDPNLQSVEDVTGYYIHARDGDIGHVEDFLISTADWAIRYLVVDTKNWWPGKHVIVAPQWASGISWSERAVTLEMTREQIETAPEYDPAQPVDRAFEKRLFEHYGRPGYWP